MKIRLVAWSLATTFLLTGIGCGVGKTPGEFVRPKTPTATTVLDDSRGACGAVADTVPLVVDWRSSERVSLEVAMKRGLVVVAYECDKFEILKNCQLAGSYDFAGVSRKEEVVQLVNADEIRANLPLSGAALAASLTRDASLDLALVLVGQKVTARESSFRSELAGACSGATHFVRAAHVGAFAMSTGTRGRTSAVAELFGAGGGAASASERRSLNRDGDLAACRQSTPSAGGPPDECQAAVRLDLVLITGDPIKRVIGAHENDAHRDGIDARDPRDPDGRPRAPDDVPGHAKPEVPNAIDAKSTSSTDRSPATQPIVRRCSNGLVFRDGKCASPSESEAHLCAPDDWVECKAQCDKGDAESCYSAGVLYSVGRVGLRKNSTKAASMFERACNTGSSVACVAFGKALYNGDGRAKDPTTALDLYRRACDHGVPEGCAQLAFAYRGRGEEASALDFALRACQTDLGSCGQAVTLFRHARDEKLRDPSRALSLQRKVCAEGHDPHRCIEYGFDAAREAQRNKPLDLSAAAWAYERACKLGDPFGCARAGHLYSAGDGVAKDAARALELLQPACTRAGGGSCAELAVLYETGAGVARDVTHAVDLYVKACSGGVDGAADSCRKAAHYLSEGKDGIARDRRRAAAVMSNACGLWSRKADEKRVLCDEAEALNRVACDIDDGTACARLTSASRERPKDAGEERAWFAANENACNKGGRVACTRIARVFREKKEFALAEKFHSKACIEGDADACFEAAIDLQSRTKAPTESELFEITALLERGCAPGRYSFRACEMLGQRYEQGISGAKDLSRAAEAYERACLGGSFGAGGARHGAVCDKAATLLETADWIAQGKQRALDLYSAQCARSWSFMADARCRAIGARLLKDDPLRAREFFWTVCEPATKRNLQSGVNEEEQIACEYFVRAGGVLPPTRSSAEKTALRR